VLRKGSVSEVQSGIVHRDASVIEVQPEIAGGQDGRPLSAREIVVLISLSKRGTDKPSNIVIRGIGPNSMLLRPQVKLIRGRMPRQGSSEIIAGESIAERFKGGDIGETLHFGMRDWNVVGIFDAGSTGFGSEIWADVDQLMQAFRRHVYSSVLFRLEKPSDFTALKARVENDPRLTIETKKETEYYAEQSEMMSKFLRILGTSLTVIFSVGAIIGAMITMYASVANRTTEIGTLRSLGFKRRNILIAFLLESLFISLIGGSAGLFFASFLQWFTVSTMNFQTFSELAFRFALTFDIVYKALSFSLIMGFIGGVLPAVKAARMNIIDALRAG
jgi:ABC-type lipoprotein release transport system permease subunit